MSLIGAEGCPHRCREGCSSVPDFGSETSFSQTGHQLVSGVQRSGIRDRFSVFQRDAISTTQQFVGRSIRHTLPQKFQPVTMTGQQGLSGLRQVFSGCQQGKAGICKFR